MSCVKSSCKANSSAMIAMSIVYIIGVCVVLHSWYMWCVNLYGVEWPICMTTIYMMSIILSMTSGKGSGSGSGSGSNGSGSGSDGMSDLDLSSILVRFIACVLVMLVMVWLMESQSNKSVMHFSRLLVEYDSIQTYSGYCSCATDLCAVYVNAVDYCVMYVEGEIIDGMVRLAGWNETDTVYIADNIVDKHYCKVCRTGITAKPNILQLIPAILFVASIVNPLLKN